MTFIDQAAAGDGGDVLARGNGATHDGNGAVVRGPVVVAAAGYRRPPLRRYPPEVVENVRRDFCETTQPIRTIGDRHGVSGTTVTDWARRFGWERPLGAPKMGAHFANSDANVRDKLIERLYRTFGRQLVALEKRAGEGGDSIEKDARTLGALAKTLETLIHLDRDDGAPVKQPEPSDRGHLRLELARKIAAWAEEEEEPAAADRPADGRAGRDMAEELD